MSNKFKELATSPIAYILCFLTTGLWLVFIFAGPFFNMLPESHHFIKDTYYYLFHFTCHQIPSRCYWVAGYLLPVCVRCLGIYLGAFLAVLFYPLYDNIKSTKMPQKKLLILCFAPIAIDGIAQVLHLYPSPHWLRLLTGVICGSIAMLFILPGLNDAARIIMEDNKR